MIDFCNKCGVCCNHLEIPPFYGPDDPSFIRLPQRLKDEIDEYIYSPLYKGEDIPCIWLDRSSGKCKNYEHRPNICKNFLVGSESCRGMRIDVGLTIEGFPIIADDN